METKLVAFESRAVAVGLAAVHKKCSWEFVDLHRSYHKTIESVESLQLLLHFLPGQLSVFFVQVTLSAVQYNFLKGGFQFASCQFTLSAGLLSVQILLVAFFFYLCIV